MGFKLTDEFQDTFKWKGELFFVDMSFDNILRLFEMFDDKSILQIEKPIIAVQMLIDEEFEAYQDKIESYDEFTALFKYLLKEFLEIDVDNDSNSQEKVVFDFNKDAEIIYASFMAEYHIDLFEVQGKLHWKKFSALLENLNDESKMKQVIGIRTMSVPSPDEASREYRDQVIKMKEVYSLDDRKAEERINDVFSEVASIFRGNK